MQLPRRSFLHLALSAGPAALFGATPTTSPVVSAGQDREGVPPRGSAGSTTFKVLTKDTAGALFVMEQTHKTRRGPDRHLHLEQDELFYVLEGEYLFEVGSERFRLKTGDSVLGPRGVPHAYLFLGSGVGRLLISYAPAGKMEDYFRQFSVPRPPAAEPTPEVKVAQRLANYAKYGMKYLGPPITE